MIADDPETVLEIIKTLIIDKNIGLVLVIIPTKCELYFTSKNSDTQVEKDLRVVLHGIHTVNSSVLSRFGSTFCEEGFRTPLDRDLKL